MATSSIKKLNGGPVRSNIPGLYVIAIEAEINGTTITSNDPTAGFTIAHASTAGDYSITFDEDAKPRSVWCGIVLNEEDDGSEQARWTGYTASTGVGLLTFYDGTTTPTDFVGTAKIILFCSKSSLAD